MKSVSFRFSDSLDELIPNCTLNLYDEQFFLVHQELSGNGLLSNIQLPPGDYFCRISSRTHIFVTGYITVSDSYDTFLFRHEGYDQTADPPSDARLCKVYGRVIGVDMRPAVGINVSISAESGYINDDDDLLTTFSNISTNKDGYLEFTVRRGSSYVLTGLPYYDYSYDDLPSSMLVNIPDRPLCKLIDIVAPIPAQINPSEITTFSGSISFLPEIIMTDGTKLLQNLRNYIEITCDTLNTISVNNVDVSISDVPQGTHEIVFYAKNFKSQVYDSSKVVKRSGLPKPVGRIRIIST